jgi:hypothetical protein
MSDLYSEMAGPDECPDNRRRGELIDRDVAGTITDCESERETDTSDVN